MYSRYKSLIRYMIYKHFLSFCELSFHFTVSCTIVFNFDEVQFTFFLSLLRLLVPYLTIFYQIQDHEDLTLYFLIIVLQFSFLHLDL